MSKRQHNNNGVKLSDKSIEDVAEDIGVSENELLRWVATVYENQRMGDPKTREETAKSLGVSYSTLYRWGSAGKGPQYYKFEIEEGDRGKVVYYPKDIYEFKESCKANMKKPEYDFDLFKNRDIAKEIDTMLK